MPFFVGIAFTGTELERNYRRVMAGLSAAIDSPRTPSVVVTHRDLALINAVEHLFPHT